MGNLVEMVLTAYKDDQFSHTIGSLYPLMINPDSLKWSRSLDSNRQEYLDSEAPPQKFKAASSAVLGFDMVIDCTGVVNSSRVDLPAEVNSLKTIVYGNNGNIHRPNFVGINWGSNQTFQDVLTSFDTSYTLFKPDGTPLRAKISLNFDSYVDPVTAAKSRNI